MSCCGNEDEKKGSMKKVFILLVVIVIGIWSFESFSSGNQTHLGNRDKLHDFVLFLF